MIPLNLQFATFLVALAITTVLGLAWHHTFLSRLRIHHPETWAKLGQPSLVLNNSIQKSISVLLFLWRKEYQDLDDPETVRIGNLLRSFLIIHLLLFVSAVLVLAAKINHK